MRVVSLCVLILSGFFGPAYAGADCALYEGVRQAAEKDFSTFPGNLPGAEVVQPQQNQSPEHAVLLDR